MSVPTPTTDVAEVKPSEKVDTRSLMALADVLGGSKTPFYTSLNPAVDGEAALLFAVSEEAHHKIADFMDKDVWIQHVYLCRASKGANEDGEVDEFPRTVLIDEKGKSYEAYSDGIAESVRKMIGVFGLPPWKPAQQIVFRKKRTGLGRTRFYCMPVIMAQTQEKKK